VSKRSIPGYVRIIAGEWRSRKLPVANVPGLRPTTDRVRETLFNWLQPYLRNARCLDLFAGTGALGFEAASRGASEVVLIEKSDTALGMLHSNRQMLKAENTTIVKADALGWLTDMGRPFDIIFIDPPFDLNIVSVCLQRLLDSACTQSGTLVYVEESRESPDHPEDDRLVSVKQGQAGQVRYTLLKVG